MLRNCPHPWCKIQSLGKSSTHPPGSVRIQNILPLRNFQIYNLVFSRLYFSLQDIWLKSQYKTEVVIWILVAWAQGPIMQGFSGLLAERRRWRKYLKARKFTFHKIYSNSQLHSNFTKYIQIQCFPEQSFEGVTWKYSSTLCSHQSLGQSSCFGENIKFSNVGLLGNPQHAAWWTNWEKLRNHWPSKYKHGHNMPRWTFWGNMFCDIFHEC